MSFWLVTLNNDNFILITRSTLGRPALKYEIYIYSQIWITPEAIRRNSSCITVRTNEDCFLKMKKNNEATLYHHWHSYERNQRILISEYLSFHFSYPLRPPKISSSSQLSAYLRLWTMELTEFGRWDINLYSIRKSMISCTFVFLLYNFIQREFAAYDSI